MSGIFLLKKLLSISIFLKTFKNFCVNVKMRPDRFLCLTFPTCNIKSCDFAEFPRKQDIPKTFSCCQLQCPLTSNLYIKTMTQSPKLNQESFNTLRHLFF